MPLISVIMPSYNHERFISEAIESVLNQTFTDLEFVIIDDASKDKSKEIIKVYEEKDSRIRAFFHSENKGIARTTNDGIERVKGEFIAFIDSDDIWAIDKLKKQAKVLEKNDDLIVWSEGEIIDATGSPLGELFTQRHNASKKKKSGDIFEELLKGNFIFGSSLIFKRENIGDIRFDERLKYLNDYKFMVNLARRYKYYFIQEPLARYRIHERNTITDKKGYLNDNITIGKYFLEKCDNKISDNTKACIFSMIINTYLSLDEVAKAGQFIHQAIKIDLIDPSNLCYLIKNLKGEVANLRNVSAEKDAQIVQLQEHTTQLQEEINKMLQLKSIRLHRKLEGVLRKLWIKR